MSALARNEQRKLLAMVLNSVASSCVTVGILAPLAAFLYTPTWSVTISAVTLLVGFVVWLTASVVLHMLARRVLRLLE